MKYKGIIFDLDGTIVDTVPLWDRASRHLLEKRGVVLTPEIIKELEARAHSLGVLQSSAAIKDMFKFDESAEQLAEEKVAHVMALYRQGIRFIDGFEAFHAKVVAKDLHKAIATNADDTTIHTTNEALNLRRFFGEHIYGLSAVNNVCKPNPAVYLRAVESLELEPHECVAIEDSRPGVEAARNAGLFCIGINTGKDVQRIKDADIIIEHYNEIDIEALIDKTISKKR
jgi:HAD superfamily hydrolase (TIGR01509 family)